MDVSERLERPILTSPLVGVMVLMEDTLLAKSLVRLVILLSAKEGISEACHYPTSRRCCCRSTGCGLQEW